MTTELAVHDDPADTLAVRPGQDMWTGKQKAALSAMGIKDATNADLAVFMHVCQRTQLDPFSRQIYMIPRREKHGDQYVIKQTIQVGIDGFRVVRDRVAERTGCTVEFEDTVWYDADGCEHAVWLDPKEAPAACRVVLIKYQDGRALRYPAVLRTASYVQTDKNGNPVSQWRTQPEHMIEKCCEAFATRRAFPNDFSGVYLEEEMNGRAAQPEPPRPRVTAAQIITGRSEQDPAGQDAAPPPDRPRRKRPGKAGLAVTDRLARLLARLPVGPEETRAEDEAVLLGWLAGEPWTGTPEQEAMVLPQLEKHVADAGGDPEEAVKAMWLSFDSARQDGDGDSE